MRGKRSVVTSAFVSGKDEGNNKIWILFYVTTTREEMPIGGIYTLLFQLFQTFVPGLFTRG